MDFRTKNEIYGFFVLSMNFIDYIYYCILYSPAFVVKNLPKESFLLYMAIVGVFGVLDHSGVDFRFPWFLFSYEARFHDLHHKHFNVNYAFPFQWPDRIFGTLKKVEK